MRAVGAAPVRLLGATARLAVRNAQRHPTRVAATTSALMIGVALITLFSVILATAREQADREIAENFPVDFALTALPGTGAATNGLPASLTDELRRHPEFGAIVRTRLGRAWSESTDRIVTVSTVDPEGAADFVLEVMAGRIDELGAGTVALRSRFADEAGVGVGDPLPLLTPFRRLARRVGRRDI